MSMPPHFNPAFLGIEFVYSAIVVFLCIFVYLKTKEMYALTKYKGIQYFRIAFLFFGLAYASRFIFYIIQFSIISFDIFVPRKILFPASFALVSYFSTIALAFLVYSTFWKRLNYKHFILFSNVIALIVVLISHLTRSPLMVALVQLPILGFVLFVNYRKKKNHTKYLYLLLSLFWILNLLVIHSRRLIPFEWKIVLQVLSIGVFAYLIYRVVKWVK